MTDTNVTKVSAKASFEGEMGQFYLASGTKLAMRMWHEAAPSEGIRATTRR